MNKRNINQGEYSEAFFASPRQEFQELTYQFAFLVRVVGAFDSDHHTLPFPHFKLRLRGITVSAENSDSSCLIDDTLSIGALHRRLHTAVINGDETVTVVDQETLEYIVILTAASSFCPTHFS
jgi:hypothetical protein